MRIAVQVLCDGAGAAGEGCDARAELIIHVDPSMHAPKLESLKWPTGWTKRINPNFFYLDGALCPGCSTPAPE